MPETTTLKTITPRKRLWALGGFLVALLLAPLYFLAWRALAPPAQAHFLWPYVKASVAVDSGIADFQMPSFRLNQQRRFRAPSRQRVIYQNLRYGTDGMPPVYGGRSIIQVLEIPLALWALTLFGLVITGARRDRRFTRNLRQGRLIMGPKVVDRREFQAEVDRMIREEKAERGIGFLFEEKDRKVDTRKDPDGRMLHLPKNAENQHFILVGAPRTGKTQIMFQMADQVMMRGRKNAVGIVHDPHGQWMERYYDPKYDLVANPFDARAFSWCPTWEIDLTQGEPLALAQALAQASSLFPGKEGDRDWFFIEKSRNLWAHLIVKHQPKTAKELAYWMDHARPEIDRRVVGNKLEQDLDPGSTPQRNGIISTFTRVAMALNAVPNPDECKDLWTVKNYLQGDTELGEQPRPGWIFFTGTADTKEALKPLQSLWVDSLIRGQLSMGVRPDLAKIFYFLDEFEAFQRLPEIQHATSQGSKFDSCFVLGFHGRSQLRNLYGEDETTSILSAPATQIFMRTKEPEATEWMQKSIGKQRLEVLEESFAPGWLTRNKLPLKTEIIERFPFIDSYFSGLWNRHGVLKHGNLVMKFKIPILKPIKRAEAWIPRVGSVVMPDEPAPLEEEKPAAKDVIDEAIDRVEKSEPKKKPGSGKTKGKVQQISTGMLFHGKGDA